MACRTVSQCPLLMSEIKLSTESTVFSEIPLSSCKHKQHRNFGKFYLNFQIFRQVLLALVGYQGLNWGVILKSGKYSQLWELNISPTVTQFKVKVGMLNSQIWKYIIANFQIKKLFPDQALIPDCAFQSHLDLDLHICTQEMFISLT